MGIGTAVLLLSWACSDRIPGQVERSTVEAADFSVNMNLLAQGFARAMADSELRLSVRDAMRDSPFTEHKLLLQEFIKTPVGGGLLDAAQRSLGWSVLDLRSLVEGMPDLEFYVPAKQQRLVWTGNSNVFVAARVGRGEYSRGFLPDGGAVTVNLWAGLPDRVFFLLAPAESRGIRILPQAEGAGQTIQDQSDGDVSGRWIVVSPRGDTTMVELAGQLAFEQCYEDCGGGGGGGGSSHTLYLTHLIINNVYDNNDPFETNEFEFRATGQSTSQTLRLEGISPNYNAARNDLIMSDLPVSMAVVETDAWPNPDDDFTKPLPNTSKIFGLTTPDNGVILYLYSWPDELDPAYYLAKVLPTFSWQ